MSIACAAWSTKYQVSACSTAATSASTLAGHRVAEPRVGDGVEDEAEFVGWGLGVEPLRLQVLVLGEVRLPVGVEQLSRIEIFVRRTVIDR